MAADGLHLFMDAIRSKESKKAEKVNPTIDNLKLLELIQLAVNPNRTEVEEARYTEIQTSLAPPDEDKDRLARHFSVPEYSLESWIHKLIDVDKVRPIRGVHFREYNSCLFGNTRVASYEVDVEEFAVAHRDRAVAAARNLIPEDQQEKLLVDGARLAREQNRAATLTEKTWILLKKETPNDTRIEDSLLRYSDEQRKKPEWHRVIANLKKYGESNGYDTIHFKQALDRWISFFLPSLQKITENMDPDEVATLLINMHKPKSSFDILQKEMMDLVRHPGEDLESKLALLRSLATTMYKDFAESERISNVERILMNGLLQFTQGTTRKNAELAIEFEKRQGKHLDFESILQGALNSERVYGAPTMPLPYNNPLNPATMVYSVRAEPVDDLTKTMSNLSTENDTFHDSFGLSAYHIDLVRQITPVVEKAIENYFVKSNAEKERGRSKEKKDFKGKSSDSKRNSSDGKRDKSGDSYKRDISSSRKWNDKDMNKGINCSADYKPRYEFRCLKCMTEGNHHEFHCKKFYRRSKFVCSNCKGGFHFREECDKERSKSRDREN